MTVDEVMEHVRNFGVVCAAHGEPDQNDGKYIRTAIETAIAQAVERETAELRARVARLSADAERYRLLRALSWNESTLCVVANPKMSVKLGSDCPSLDRLDEILDAILSTKEKT